MLLSSAELSIADDDDHASVRIRDGSAISTSTLSATAPTVVLFLAVEVPVTETAARQCDHPSAQTK